MCSFLFFKQKTAYEMRISDWSSDVCSSDLGDQAAPHRRLDMALVGQRGDHDHAPHPARHHVVEEGALVFRVAVGVADDDAVTEMTPGIGLDQIGRASCRERVGQYV